MNVYLFDVDDTLEISNGPISLSQLVNLKNAGHIIGLCGNWAVMTSTIKNWHHIINCFNVLVEKYIFMKQLMKYIPAKRYVFVGNRDPDELEATKAGWEFVSESDFKEGL